MYTGLAPGSGGIEWLHALEGGKSTGGVNKSGKESTRACISAGSSWLTEEDAALVSET